MNARVFLTLIVLACAASPAFAQRAALTGTVTDQSGGVLSGVTITVVNADQGLKRNTTTNQQGHFAVPLLPPGSYTLAAQLAGFAPVEVQALVLNVGDVVTLNLKMEVGKLGETVMVQGEAVRASTSAAVSTVVDRQFVENLPLNGRSFNTLIELTPGVVLAKATFQEQGQFSVNGQRTSANYYMVDGVSANVGVNAGPLGQSGGGSLPAFTAFGGTSNLVSIDALQEFRIQTSTFAPEFGRTPGAQISIATRSGTNAFHGSVFEYFRNDSLDATDWFVNSRGLSKPPLRQNDFGGVLGGPIQRDRAFFFFSYEGVRLRQPQFTITEVPSLSVREMAVPEIRPYLNGFPVPNGPETAGGFAQFAASYANPSSLDATSIRIDHKLTTGLSVFGRYNYAPSQNLERTLNAPQNLTDTRFETQTMTLGATWAISPRLFNDFRGNYSRTEGGSLLSVDDFGGAVPPSDDQLFPPFASRDTTLYTLFLGPSFYRLGVGKNTVNLQRQTNLVNTLSLLTGSHELKFGVDYRRLTPLVGSREADIQVIFNTVPAAASGVASSIFVAGREAMTIAFTNLSLFAQDTWKATPRLTATYGLRWEYNTPPSSLTDGKELYTLTGLDNPSTLALGSAGTPLWEAQKNNFAPRFGLAYQLTQSGSTVLRGGGGVFYDLGAGQVANGPIGAPFVRSRSVANVPYPLVDPNIARPPAFTLQPPFGFTTAFDPEVELPYTWQWNASIERALGSTQALTASYVGAAGRRLLRQELLFNPNASFGRVQVTFNGSTSDYHALQLQYQRRLSRGFQATAAYTLSKSEDDVSEDSTLLATSEVIAAASDRGPSSFDVRHSFITAVTYDVPTPSWGRAAEVILGNWSVDAILRARSGTPINVIAGRDVLAVGVTTAVRPDLVPGVDVWIDDPLAPGGRRLNSAAFAVPTGRQGNLPRNAFRGFGAHQVDLALRREVVLLSDYRVQFRAEFFNMFNHPNFADPVTNLQSGLFGQSVQMLGRSLGTGGISGGFNPLFQVGGPRSIQLALKFLF